jgi:hypothetical protein
MSIDSRFGKERFRVEAEVSPGARDLADQLQAEVVQLLQDCVTTKMREIVSALNEQGHQLHFYYPPEPGHVAFRDDCRSGSTNECDLRLAVDVVVSAGFRDTVPSTDEASEKDRGPGENGPA